MSGDRFPQFSRLLCDLVFVVDRKYPWTRANDLSRDDPVVDSGEAWADHYRWYPQHPLTRRSRFTLKADPEHSFQAQADDAGLIDIVPLLEDRGITLASLRAGTGSQPVTIPVHAADAITRTQAEHLARWSAPTDSRTRQRRPRSHAPRRAAATAGGVTAAARWALIRVGAAGGK